MPRIDEVEKYYSTAKKLDKISNNLFYAVAAAAIAIPLIKITVIKEVVAITFIVLVVAYFILRYSGTLFFLPRSERMRRKQLLTDSLGLQLVAETTVKYYNNPFEPSVKRLAANILENSFFTQHVLERMLVGERIRVFLYFLLWIVAAASNRICEDVIVVFSQSLFSAEIIARWITMEIYRLRCSEVYSDMFKYFSTGLHAGTEALPCVVDGFSDYECAKASANIVTSSKIFYKINPALTVDWEKIKVKLGIVSEPPNN